MFFLINARRDGKHTQSLSIGSNEFKLFWVTNWLSNNPCRIQIMDRITDNQQCNPDN